MSENRIDGLTLHRMATYIFVEACNNSQSGNYIISIEDVEKTFEVQITKKIYNKICNILEDDFSLQLLDLNEGDNDYYFDKEKAFDITIGGYYTIYGDTDYEDYENYEDEEDDEYMGKKIGDYTIYEKRTMCNGNCKECKYRVGDETKKITSYCKLVMIEYQNEELEKDGE